MSCGSTSSRCCQPHHPGPAAGFRAGCPTATAWPRSSWLARRPLETAGPISVMLSAANANGSTMFEAVPDDSPAIRMPTGRRRCRPGKVHADKAHDHRRCRGVSARSWDQATDRPPHDRVLPAGGPPPLDDQRIWAWLGGWRRLRICYERSSQRFYALVLLACSVITSARPAARSGGQQAPPAEDRGCRRQDQPKQQRRSGQPGDRRRPPQVVAPMEPDRQDPKQR
jgi:hypothetical protein